MLSCYCKGGEDMQIQPNSIIKLCSGVPIDSSYKDTIYFTSRESQKSYFDSKVSKTMDKASFQRINGQQGIVRMSANAESIYDCNYMMFQNTNYGSKWFYAFITNIVYVNDKVSNVYFSVDVMQTWFLFDCTLKECFVEREHSVTDNIEDCIIEENISIQEYAIDGFKNSGLFNTWEILALAPYNHAGKQEQSTEQERRYNGVACGNYANVITDGNATAFNGGGNKWEGLYEWLLLLAEKGYSDSIQSISMIPTSLITGMDLIQDTELPISDTTSEKPFSVRKPSTKIGNYTPKNNKLFTYPYSFLGITNGSGEMAEYRWEWFERNSSNPFCTFEVLADFITGTYNCIPLNYNGSNRNGDTNYNLSNSLIMTSVPLCSFNTDAYTVWFAQNKVNMLQKAIIGGIAGEKVSHSYTPKYNFNTPMQNNSPYSMPALTGGGQVSGALQFAGMVGANTASAGAGALFAGAGAVLSIMGDLYKAQTMPDYVRGGGGSSTYLGKNFQDFMYTHVHVQEEVAKSIDDFFSVYGYATKRVKVPNINVRPHWTYTKTIDCNIISTNCSNNDLTAIKNIFDNGITFWKNASEIGNYSLDNSPS